MKKCDSCDNECNLCGMFRECDDRKYDLDSEEMFGTIEEEDEQTD